MFGKKKSAEGGEPTHKAAKPSKKGSAPKSSSPNFFAAHAEKLALGVVVLALGYLVYEGVGGKGYDPQRQPPQLAQMADKLINDISANDPWPELEKERVIAHDFAKRTEEARQPSDPSLYPLPVMEVQDKGAYEKRGDPELLAPIKVIGQSVVGLIAVEAAENAVDPFEDFEDAEKLEGNKRRERESNRRGQTGAAAGYGAGYGMAGSGSEPGPGTTVGGTLGGYGLGQGEGPKRMFPPEYNKGFSAGGGSAMGGYGMSGGMAGYGMGMGSGGSTPTGSALGTGAGATLGSGAAAKQKKTLAQPIYFNAVTALVPHEEMIKDYTAKLRESASFMLPRDLPLYLSFEVQRVEVTERNQQINEEDWKTVTDASKQLSMMKNWLPKFPQQIPDVIDPSAADRALTMPIPPLLIQDYRPFVKHPDIDWAWDAGMAQMQQPPIDATAPDMEAIEGRLPGELAPAGGASGGYGMGMMGMGMGAASGSGYGMASGSTGYGMGGSMPGYGSGTTSSGYGASGTLGGYGAEGSGSGGMAGYGMGMSSGGSGYGMSGTTGGYGMGGYGMGAPARPAPYKMIRFYDQLSEKDVRKTFKYRVRVMMEDPNYPSDRFPAPPSADMKDDVFARVAKLRQKEDPEAEAVRKENLNARANTPKKIYNRTKRYTPWSEPSKGIYVRGTEDVYIGKFPAKKTLEPTVEAVLVKLDARGAYVPMYAFVTKDGKRQDQPPAFHRGAVLVMKALTTQFAHPITTVIKEWPDYGGFTGGSTVVDIRGNDPLVLGESKDDPLTDNGEMMLLMGDGRVEITNEFDDAFWYRAFTLADEREAADKAPPASEAPTPTGGSPTGS